MPLVADPSMAVSRADLVTATKARLVFSKLVQTNPALLSTGTYTVSGFSVSAVSVVDDTNAAVTASTYNSPGYYSNILLWSEDSTNAVWTRTACTVTSNSTTTPNGNPAMLIVPTTANTTHQLSQNISFAAATSYTISITAKMTGAYNALGVRLFFPDGATTHYGTINLSTGATSPSLPDGSTIASLGNGWYRYSYAAKGTAGGNTTRIDIFPNNTTVGAQASFAGDGTSGFYVGEIMVEQKTTSGAISVQDTYIKTTDHVRYSAHGHAVQLTLSGAPSFTTPTAISVTDSVIAEGELDSYLVGAPGNSSYIVAPGSGTERARSTSKGGRANPVVYPTLRGVITAKQPPAIPVTTTNISSVSGANTAVTITLNRDVLLTGIALNAASFSIVNEGGYSLPVYAVAPGPAGSKTLLLTTGELGSTHTYTLTIPSSGIIGSDTGTTLLPPYTYAFTGSGTTPMLVKAVSINATTVDVYFSKSMDTVSATNLNNYQITSPSVAILAISTISPQVFRLTTAIELPNTTYSLTVSNILDTAGNIV